MLRADAVVPGLRLWVVYRHRGLRTAAVTVERVDPAPSPLPYATRADGRRVTVRGPNGGAVEVSLFEFVTGLAGRVVGEPLYEVTEVALSGAWRDVSAGSDLRKALTLCRATAACSYVRKAYLTRVARYGLKGTVAEMAGLNGRAWAWGRRADRGALSALMWRGTVPGPESGAVEVTGKDWAARARHPRPPTTKVPAEGGR